MSGSDASPSEYTIPGIVDFLLVEWRRWERDRAAWDKDRALLQSELARLEGEKQGYERVQNDLIRRIKMLEHVIRQERAKSSHLPETSAQKDGVPAEEPPVKTTDAAQVQAVSAVLNRAPRTPKLRGQAILQKYLEQMNAADHVLSARSRTLPVGIFPRKSSSVSAATPSAIAGTPPAVDGTTIIPTRTPITTADNPPPARPSVNPSAVPLPIPGEIPGTMPSGKKLPANMQRMIASAQKSVAGSEDLQRVAPVVEEPIHTTSQQASKIWTHRQAMRAHMDSVRAVCFTESSSALVSASEDGTLKLWALRDTDPVFTYRGHTGAVLCAAVSEQRGVIVSGGLDSSVRVWKLLNASKTNIFDPVGAAISNVQATYVGHTDAVWDVALQQSSPLVVTASADGSVRVWKSDEASPLTQCVRLEQGHVPTSATFVAARTNQAVAADTLGQLLLFDVTTGKHVTQINTAGTDSPSLISKVVVHGSLNLAITAHEDKFIKMTDISSGKVVRSFVAHPDSVSALAIDPNELYIASGGHDGSLRFWDVRKGIMVQEQAAHHRKFDEGVLSVAYHPTKTFVATSGADSVIKLYQ